MIFPLTAHLEIKKKKKPTHDMSVLTPVRRPEHKIETYLAGACFVTDIRAKGSLQAKYWQAVLLQHVSASCCV